MERSIQDVARLTGTTSRTLRHYDSIGLLTPSRIGQNGYRYYDGHALVILQRILLLRQLGLGLDSIATIIAGERDDAEALQTHLRWLETQRERLNRQIRAVEHTLSTLTTGEKLMAEDMFDGFDHTDYREETEERWGADRYAASDAWWRALTDAERKEFLTEQVRIQDEFGTAQAAGHAPESVEAQAVAARQCAWIARSARGSGMKMTQEYVIGLGEMYVADPRFRKSYTRHSPQGAEYVRDALRVYAETSL
ncbi:TipAS antibiotic-recognition domain-containing protein [Klugiella xanthotipulae]|uniref:DNA-binding transcriptional MerR regulator n=1 Tax=Klugiella xanthotipulae TaxID=244735 RepID=A0A543HXZ7_9MICO|nr:MerR family transcriptional regulator [Klugiella xanthotipulae]TQM63224.1 DNA-binding transcriptional MerR regulator [Klugiella xanthotipulae]